MQVQHKKGQNPYFKLKDIAKTFGITKALSGVTLDIYAGEVMWTLLCLQKAQT